MSAHKEENKILKEKLQELEGKKRGCAEYLGLEKPISDEEQEAIDRQWQAELDRENAEEELVEIDKQISAVKTQLYQNSIEEIEQERAKKYVKENDSFENGKIVNEVGNVDAFETDIFDRKRLAVSIAEELCDDLVASPNNIAVLGDWGSGKTTFLSYIREHIENKNKKISSKHKQFKIIKFNAAEYSSKIINQTNY